MKKMFKKNQVIITALAIMIAVAGYLNFTSDKPLLDTEYEDVSMEGADGNEDEEEISAAVEDEIDENIDAEPEELASVEEGGSENGDLEDVADASLDVNGEPIDGETVGETVLTNASVTLSQAKLNREQTRSKTKEMLLEIINNESLDEAAKKDAIDQMLNMTKRMEMETAAETQLAAKGFADSIVSISDQNVDITLSIANLNDVQRAQIEDIITRKTGYELNQIVITTTNQ